MKEIGNIAYRGITIGEIFRIAEINQMSTRAILYLVDNGYINIISYLSSNIK